MCNCRMRWSIFRNFSKLWRESQCRYFYQINWTCSKAVLPTLCWNLYISGQCKKTNIESSQTKPVMRTMWTSLPMIVTWWLMRAKPNVFARQRNQKAPPKVSGLWRSLWSSDCTERSIGHWVVVQGWRVVDPMGRLLRSEAKGFGSSEL